MKNTLSPQLIRKMRRTFSYLDNKYPFINSGGCGVFAVALAKILRRLGYDARIVALKRLRMFWENDRDITIFRHNQALKTAITQNKDAWVTKSHYVVRVGNTYIDSCNIKKSIRGEFMLSTSYYNHRFKVILGNVPIQYLEHLTKNCAAWNPKYNRNNDKPLIKYLKTNLL